SPNKARNRPTRRECASICARNRACGCDATRVSGHDVGEAIDGGEPVPRIERRDLVRLGKGRVVEDRIDEVVDSASEGDCHLPDMDELCCTSTEYVDAEDAVIDG